jgi:hypothetical protein
VGEEIDAAMVSCDPAVADQVLERGCDALRQTATAKDDSAWREFMCGLTGLARYCGPKYPITWFPKSSSDWDIVPIVEALRATAVEPAASRSQLLAGVSRSETRAVTAFAGRPAQELAVEQTSILVELPYSTLAQRLPAARWGVSLDHYLGGQVRVYERDSLGRPTRQLERMVLSPFPCDLESTLTNNDMTKVEVIRYLADRATVYWRVMHSDNNSTVIDVGSVEFRRHDAGSTLITFHSAHELNMPGGIAIPNWILEPALRSTFLDFVRHYSELVADR